ncbi:MAG: hypothetical protein F6K28_00720 [Microcoleus sp. SIO2G3]|nr:hypothetical protein [Microcoleus sp. SIO2G3]
MNPGDSSKETFLFSPRINPGACNHALRAEDTSDSERRLCLPFSASSSVSDELYTAGQPTPGDLQQAAQEGFKSVVNLRSPNEADFLSDEQQQAEAAGLNYVNVPLNSKKADHELTAKCSELQTSSEKTANKAILKPHSLQIRGVSKPHSVQMKLQT